MPATTFRDDTRAGRLREARLKRRASNKIATALDTLPVSIKREWTHELQGDAKGAFQRLLVGASHVCPACGFDAGPRTNKGVVYACGCERPNVNALRLYCELTGDVGPANQFIVSLNAQLGVRNEQELAMFVRRGKSLAELDDASVEVHWQEAMTLIELCLKEKPELYLATQKWLAGLSTATLVEPHQSAQDALGATNGTHLDPEDA
jgi:hypothetical protein